MGGSDFGEAMGGSDFGDDWELPAPPSRSTTVVLVGRTGAGKSATGNSIIGKKVFKSKCSAGAVSLTCDLQEAEILDGRLVRVIDTPGMFDPKVKPEFVKEEIMKCLDLAKDGVHALLLVLSVKNRFTEEEMVAVESLQTIFGEKVLNYMVVVFTNGDELEDSDETLESYLSDPGSPDFLRNLIKKCGNRTALFENKTKDRKKREDQISELMSVIDRMVNLNGGNPYTSEILVEARKLAESDAQSKFFNPSGGVRSKDFEEMKKLLEEQYKSQLDQVRIILEDKLRLNSERLEEKIREKIQMELEEKLRLEREKMEAKMEAKSRLEREKMEARSAKDLEGLKRELERANKEKAVEEKLRLEREKRDAKSAQDLKELRKELERAHKERQRMMEEMNSNRGGCSIL